MTLTKRVLQKNRFCIYCGGAEPATQADHAPPLGLFNARKRPNELVVAVCAGCHNGTRKIDAFMGWLTRAYPPPKGDAELLEMLEKTRSIVHNFPELATEIIPGPHSDKTGGVLLLGPLAQRAIMAFSARMTFAIHHHMTGQIITDGEAVLVDCVSNVDALEGRLPGELLSVLGDSQTLRQGKWDVGDQFTFAAAPPASADGVYAYWAQFRATLAFSGYVAPDSKIPFWAARELYYKPRFLRNFIWPQKAERTWPGVFGLNQWGCWVG